MNYPVVRIKWIDSLAMSEWIDKEDIPMTCHESETVGFLIKEDEEVVIVSHTVNQPSGQQVAGYISIPTAAIISQKYRDEAGNKL